MTKLSELIEEDLSEGRVTLPDHTSIAAEMWNRRPEKHSEISPPDRILERAAVYPMIPARMCGSLRSRISPSRSCRPTRPVTLHTQVGQIRSGWSCALLGGRPGVPEIVEYRLPDGESTYREAARPFRRHQATLDIGVCRVTLVPDNLAP